MLVIQDSCSSNNLFTSTCLYLRICARHSGFLLVIIYFFLRERNLLAKKDCAFFLQIKVLAYRIRVTALPVRKASVHGLEIEIGPAGSE